MTATVSADGPAEDREPAEAPTGELLLPHGVAPVAVNAPVGGHARLARWALVAALVALAVSFFVGWGFPLGVAAIAVGIVAVRRPWESRAVAVWAIVLGALSVVYSAGWLVYAAIVTSSGR